MELQSSEGKTSFSVVVSLQAPVAKADSVIVMLKNAFVFRYVNIWKKLYFIQVRSRFEYAVSVWKSLLCRYI